MAIDTRITMIAMTIISSTMVKPDSPRRIFLPVGIFRPIRRRLRALGVNVKNVLPAPAIGRRIVLRTAHAPVDRVSEGIFGDAPEESDFLVYLAGQLHSLDQRFQLVGIPIGVQLGRSEIAGIGVILVLIDGI